MRRRKKGNDVSFRKMSSEDEKALSGDFLKIPYTPLASPELPWKMENLLEGTNFLLILFHSNTKWMQLMMKLNEDRIREINHMIQLLN